MTEKKTRIPPGFRKKIYYEVNPWTNIRYRRERIVPINDVNQPPESPPQTGLLTKEELEAQQKKAQEEAFANHQATRPDLYPKD